MLQLPDLQLEPSRSETRENPTSGRVSSRATRSSKTRKSSVRTRIKSSASHMEDEYTGKENSRSPEPTVKFADKFPINIGQFHDRLPDYMEPPIVYTNIMADVSECDDLTLLPPPKKIMQRKDAPWIYRFKVKRNMNVLSKLMASKPSQVAAQTSLGT